MDNLSLIVAMGENNEIGKDNKLLWHLPNDLKFFKETTMNKTIIMGRKTFESLPKMLPNRKHIVLTNNPDYNIDGITVFNGIDDVLEYIKNSNEDCFIIGGASVYKEFLPFVKNLYITRIEATKEADAFFPQFDTKNYKETILGENEDNNIKYTFYKYIKID